ncbi:MAG: hydroxymethylglutaryl-CoA reductase, partial [Muricauda sp.]|nr:hydroxymethylglutaryl-CoA reductase [Allomuricauda sp.]
MQKPVEGFSKFTKEEKIKWLVDQYCDNPKEAGETLRRYWHQDPHVQKRHDEFIENTLSNYYLPFAIAPNFLINERL